MKRIFSLLLVVALLFVMAACGDSSTPSTAPAPASSGGEGQSDAPVATDTAFPEKNIKIIVPFDAGGGVDICARIISDAAGKDYFNGNSIIVENMPGGGAIIGQTNVANSAPDGYTILAYTSSVVTNPMFNQTTFEYTDFKTIAMFCFDPELLIVPKDSPYNTLEEFIAAAKENALSMSTPGHTTSHHMAGLKMENMMGVTFNYLHNDGANAQMQQIMGGHTDSALVSVGEGAALVAEGSVKALAVMSEERVDTIPDVPTYIELGYDLVDGAFRGLAVPKDTPAEVVAVLDQQFGEILNTEKFNTSMANANMPVGYKNSADFDAYVDEVAKGLEELLPILQPE